MKWKNLLLVSILFLSVSSRAEFHLGTMAGMQITKAPHSNTSSGLAWNIRTSYYFRLVSDFLIGPTIVLDLRDVAHKFPFTTLGAAIRYGKKDFFDVGGGYFFERQFIYGGFSVFSEIGTRLDSFFGISFFVIYHFQQQTSQTLRAGPMLTFTF